MLKKVFTFLKRIIFSAFLLYGYNLIAAPLNLIIPINVITVLALAILGIPALFAFMIILLVIF